MNSPQNSVAGLLLCCSVTLSQLLTPIASADVNFPADAGVINMQTDLTQIDTNASVAGIQPIYAVNCAADGSTDDTNAIKAAIAYALRDNTRYWQPRILYFPDGVYLVTNSLESKNGTSWRAGMILWGESEAGTVIKLQDNQTGFNLATDSKPVIITGSENATEATGGGNAQAFRHFIKNLTVDTGANNIGAIGIDFMASNSGAMRNVTIRSSDATKRGKIGLKSFKTGGEVGPMIISNLTIIGFEEGVAQKNYDYSVTYENLVLQDQRTRGITLTNATATFRKLTSNNTVQVMNLTNSTSLATLYEGVFSGATTGTAISNSGTLLVRDLQSTGYATVVDNLTGTGTDVTGGAGTTSVSEFHSHSPKTAFDNPTVTLRITPEETPTHEVMDVSSDWVNVVTHGATPDNNSNDDAVGINAAIAAANTAGKPIVYLPNGTYDCSTPIVISGTSVKKILGCGVRFQQKTGFVGSELVRFDSTASVIIEHMRIHGDVVHNSAGTFAITDCTIYGKYYNTSSGTGKTFIDDIQCGQTTINTPHTAFVRNINIEIADDIPFVNNGARVWMMGIKTEQTATTRMKTQNGGFLELLGSNIYVNDNQVIPTDRPCFIIDNSHFSGMLRVGKNNWPTVVREVRGTTTIDKTTGSLYSGTPGLMRAYFAGYTAFPPRDDTFVRDGSYASTNYNTTTTLHIKASSSGFNRKVLIKHNLTGMINNAATASLELRVVSIDATNPPTPSSPLQLNVYNTTDSWTENLLTWNLLPTRGTLIGSASITGNNQTITINATSAFNSERSGDKILSFYIEGASSSNKFVSFADRTNYAFTPLLKFTN